MTVIDHRPAYLSRERFPDAQRIDRRPADGLDGLPLGPRTHLVVMTHSFAHDREWVRCLLRSDAAYIGLLGPRARKDEILEQIDALGTDGSSLRSVSIWVRTDQSRWPSASWRSFWPSALRACRATCARRTVSSMPAERNGAVAGVVLAAGSSTRMGRNKLFFELDGETLLRRVVRRAIGAGLDPVIVVVGHEGERAGTELSGLSCTTVVNPDHAEGINRSLQTGISHVPERARAAVVMLADMPFVTSSMVAGLVTHYRESTAPLVISAYGDVNAPPMLYDRALFPELQRMTGEGCGRQVVRRHRHEAVAVPWPEAALRDIDVPEDYERIKAELATG